MKYKISVFIALLGLVVFGMASFASAKDNATSSKTKEDPKPTSTVAKALRMEININPSGQAQITGVVASVSTSSFALKSWGGFWNVNVATDTILTGQGGQKIQTSLIRAGDYVSVHGSMDKEGSLTINARVIKDSSLLKGDKREEIKKEVEVKKEEKKTFFQRIKGLFVKEKSATSTSVTLSGKTVCLPHREKGDFQTMECAIGLLSDNKYYGLAFTQKDQSIDTGKNVTISGRLFQANTEENKFDRLYDVVGRIEVSSIQAN